MTTEKGRDWREVRADAIARGQITEKGVAAAGERRAKLVRDAQSRHSSR